MKTSAVMKLFSVFLSVCGITVVLLLSVVLLSLPNFLFADKANGNEAGANNITRDASTDLPDVAQLLIIVLHDDNSHHISNARLLRSFIYSQRDMLKNKMHVEVILSHEEWPDVSGVWTTFPVIDDLAEHYTDYDWAFFVQEYTEVSLLQLHNAITKYNYHHPLLIGRALRDHTATIIHHYANHENPKKFAYPDFGSGFLMTFTLVKQASKRWRRGHSAGFSIDPKHELANDILVDFGVSLIEEAGFCSPAKHSHDDCITYYNTDSLICTPSSAHKAVTEDQIFVLVKTCEKFLDSRVHLQKRLWTNKVFNLEYCSEKENRTIPTIGLNIENTEKGHCRKLWEILYRAHTFPHINTKDWLVIVDDDTIMSIKRLLRLLTCYNYKERIALGEKYGYGVRRGGGYDYITGGGGIVLSMKTVHALMKVGVKCPQDDSPDDMMLGAWLKKLEIPISHSPLFHQATPSSYAPEYLDHQKDNAISFHKYTDDNPETVARDWLGLDVSYHDEL